MNDRLSHLVASVVFGGAIFYFAMLFKGRKTGMNVDEDFRKTFVYPTLQAFVSLVFMFWTGAVAIFALESVWKALRWLATKAF